MSYASILAAQRSPQNITILHGILLPTVRLWSSLGRSTFSWFDGSGGSCGSCGSVALNGSGGSGGLMSLLDLFGLVDQVCHLCFWGYFIAS